MNKIYFRLVYNRKKKLNKSGAFPLYFICEPILVG